MKLGIVNAIHKFIKGSDLEIFNIYLYSDFNINMFKSRYVVC